MKNENRRNARQAASESPSGPEPKLGALPVWNLDDLYPGPDSAQLKQDLEWLETACRSFAETFEGRIASLDSEGLLKCVEQRERIDAVAGRILSFASLRHAQDTLDPANGKLLGDCGARVSEAKSRLAFFEIELNDIEADAYARMIESNAGLRRYRQVLDRLRKLRPHLLSAELERYVSEKSASGTAAWIRLFDQTAAAMRFGGAGEELTLEQVLDRMSSPNRAVREKSAKALAVELDRNLPLFTLITNTLAKDKEIEDRWRRFETAQASRHLANDIEPGIIDAMAEAVAKAFPEITHRYYQLKARWLGVDKLEVWDRSAPLPEDSDRRIPWEEAKSTVLAAFEAFSPRMSETAAQFFDNSWIDAAVRPGKAGGGFSHPTVADAHPYILLNYQGRPRDVMIMAHELGHGIHQVLAAQHGEWLSDTPLTLAETASVFGEALTFRSLVASARDAQERQQLLAGRVEDTINTVMRQVAFYRFESRLHETRRSGELEPDDINAIWLETQRECLGPAFEFMDGYKVFWSYVPHFVHAPFYVYSYAFGSGLVQALFAVYMRGLEGFVPRYFDLLAAGGSRPYKDLLEPFGIDVADPEFWRGGMSTVSEMIDELEALEA